MKFRIFLKFIERNYEILWCFSEFHRIFEIFEFFFLSKN